MSRIAIIGAGPTGLAAYHELISTGTSPSDVVIIAPNVLSSPRTSDYVPSLLQTHESFDAARVGGALSKVGGPNLGDPTSHNTDSSGFQPAEYWGSSCLPPPQWMQVPEYENQLFLDGYAKTVGRWGVQAEDDPLKNIYPLTGESLGLLRRKPMALEICRNAQEVGVVVGHSRIAISNRKEASCTYCGRCLQGCPINVPWSPASELSRLRQEFLGFQGVSSTVEGITLKENGVRIRTSDGGSLDFDRVLLAAGWRNTPRLYSAAMNLPLQDSYDLRQSVVIMKPIFFSSDFDPVAYGNSFSYHDLVMSIPPQLDRDGYTIQIYLPTPELAGRLFSQAPRLFHSLVGASLSKKGKSLSWLERRCGVAMIFTEGGGWDTTKSRVRKVESHVLPSLKAVLRTVGGHVIPLVHEVLDSGRSEHVGSWAKLREMPKEILSGGWDPTRQSSRLIPIDTSMLPRIPAGPHTASAAALARVIANTISS